jgi:hypothetical protein
MNMTKQVQLKTIYQLGKAEVKRIGREKHDTISRVWLFVLKLSGRDDQNINEQMRADAHRTP